MGSSDEEVTKELLVVQWAKCNCIYDVEIQGGLWSFEHIFRDLQRAMASRP